MRLRNIPGAKETIENNRFVVHELAGKEGKLERGFWEQQSHTYRGWNGKGPISYGNGGFESRNQLSGDRDV